MNIVKEYDSSSTGGSDFETLDAHAPQEQEEEQQNTEDNNDDVVDVVDGKSSNNSISIGHVTCDGNHQRIGELEKLLLEERLKVAEWRLKAQKEKAYAEKAKMKMGMMKAKMETLELQKLQMEAEKTAGEEGNDLQKMELQSFKEDILKSLKQMLLESSGKPGEENKLGVNLLADELRLQLQTALQTFKQDIRTSLKHAEQDGRALKLKKLVDKERLKDWLSTGVGQLRNVTILRIASNKLITIFGGFAIQEGRLKANTTGSGYASVRAEKPFPLFNRPFLDEQMLRYFEVTVTAKGNSWLFIGLSAANYPFSSTTFVGRHTGSFAILNTGTYYALGQKVDGNAKGHFSAGDVIGCGLLVMPKERHIFFTKNGEIWCKPILLGPDDANMDLFPTVSGHNAGRPRRRCSCWTLTAA